jgi:hypothetical protein
VFLIGFSSLLFSCIVLVLFQDFRFFIFQTGAGRRYRRPAPAPLSTKLAIALAVAHAFFAEFALVHAGATKLAAIGARSPVTATIILTMHELQE